MPDVDGLRPGDACEVQFPARNYWMKATVVINGGGQHWIASLTERVFDTVSGKAFPAGHLVTGIYAEQVRPLYVVRLWDGFDGEWMDVSEPVPQEEADALCRKKNRERGGTAAGNEEGAFADIDYYKVFPADTKMVFSEGRSLK